MYTNPVANCYGVINNPNEVVSVETPKKHARPIDINIYSVAVKENY